MRTTILCFVVSAMFTSGCGFMNHQPINQVSDSGAEQAVVSKVPKYRDKMTYEQWAIDRRVQVTNDPAKILWMHLIAEDGSIVRRMAVRCKTVSSGKRLYPTSVTQIKFHSTTAGENNNVYGDLPVYTARNGQQYYTTELMKPDGTFGKSEPYKYWFDPMMRYHEIGSAGGGSMSYLLTDYPIDLEDPVDKISGLYKVDEISRSWQEEQEAKLRHEVH